MVKVRGNIKELKSMVETNGIVMPYKGSGKNGKFVKIDYVTALERSLPSKPILEMKKIVKMSLKGLKNVIEKYEIHMKKKGSGATGNLVKKDYVQAIKDYVNVSNKKTTTKVTGKSRILDNPDEILLNIAKHVDSKDLPAFFSSCKRTNSIKGLVLKDKCINKKTLNKALISSVTDGMTKSVESLLNHGADINTPFDKESRDLTSLYIASKYGHIDIVKLLLEKGADPNIAPSSEYVQYVPLLVAVEENYIEIVKLLLEKGANINVDSRFGTPLIRALYMGNTEIAKLLLQKGADVNVYNNRHNEGWNNPLTLASYRGYTEIVKLLLKKGAYNPLNKARLLASDEGHTKIVKLLSDYVAKKK